MTNNIPSPSNQPPKRAADAARRLPSFRVRCALAVGLFALGIALGAAVGPTPQSSLAVQTAAPNALIASLLSRYAASPTATATASAASTSPSGAAPGEQGSPSPAALPAAAPPAGPASSSTPAAAVPNAPASAPSATTPISPPSGPPTPPAKGQPPTPLPAIEHVWLITLPGAGFTSALAQSSADPYLSQQLAAQGTLLKSYSSLAASALSADAALLSGQSAPGETSYAAPGCDTTAQPACTPGSTGELAGVDAYLSQLIPQITASAEYREHGLIAIAFSGPGAGSPPSSKPAPTAAGTPGTLAGQPLGVLLLSPFLRKRGGQSNAPFHPATPRKDLERLLHG
ncbi:MAG TPA: hypothetical protein VIC06_00360 [Solirubrobacteraceae bacterium]|jgi:hypothetical protein